jgi:hypothetical protein
MRQLINGTFADCATVVHTDCSSSIRLVCFGCLYDALKVDGYDFRKLFYCSRSPIFIVAIM